LSHFEGLENQNLLATDWRGFAQIKAIQEASTRRFTAETLFDFAQWRIHATGQNQNPHPNVAKNATLGWGTRLWAAFFRRFAAD
jgi:hypothetical protein